MKVKDLFTNKCNGLDVYENTAEMIGIAFVNDNKNALTDEGKKHFSKALNCEVERIDSKYIIIDTQKELEKLAKKSGMSVSQYELQWSYDDYDDCPSLVQNLIDLFWSYAGYCSKENYKKWFNSGEN